MNTKLDTDFEDTIVTDNFEAKKSEIIDILAGNIPALGALLRVTDIQASTSITTACVTNRGAPVIMYNPEFVNKHCKTKAHMAMLLLHEIYHVLLGHTMAKAITPTDNLIADAIINAMICMQYQSFGFQSFFMDLYDKKEMPAAFLRPKSRPARFWQRRKYNQLYTVMGLSWEDIKDTLHEHKDATEDVILLGDHSGTNAGGSVMPDVILDGIAGGVLEDIESEVNKQQQKRIQKLQHQKWNQEYAARSGSYTYSSDEQKEAARKAKELISKIEEEISQIKSAGSSASIFVRLLKKRLNISKRKKELEEELRKVAQQSIYSKLEVKLKGMFPKIPETSVLPNYRNRRAIVSLVSEQYNPFFQNPLRAKDFGAVTIYIDVSGSMNGFISTIYKLACNCKDFLEEKIYLFSNDVRGITKDELLKGVIKTTGGTDDVFLTHALDHNKKKIMVFTDGYLHVSKENMDRVKQTGTKIVAAYTPNHQKLPKRIIHSELVMELYGEAKLVNRRKDVEEDTPF